MATERQEGTWALLVGINRYPNFPAHNQLAGCVNDVTLMRDLLTDRFSFPQDSINILVDEGATRERILQSLDALVEKAGQDDIVVFYYAGHGSWRKSSDRPTGKLETIVPYDSGRSDRENRDITEDELRLRLLRLARRTRHTTLIFDCCHSETLIRDAFGDRERSVEGDLRVLPSDELSVEARTLVQGSHSKEGGPALTDRYVLLAACREDEKAYEHRDGPAVHGAFSFFLMRELLREVETPRSWRQIFEKVAVQVSAAKPAQHPRAEGVRDQFPFGRAALPPRLTVGAHCWNGKRVTLQAGAAHGVLRDSAWDLFVVGTAEFNAPLGRIVIRQVQEFVSEAELLTPGPMVAGPVRALEVTRPRLESKWSVFLDPGLPTTVGAQFSKWVGASRRLTLAESAERATAIVRPEPVGSQSLLAVVERSGQPLLRRFRDEEHLLVMEDLECLARYQEFLAVDNPKTSLAGKVELRLLGQSAGGSWYRRNAEGGEYSLVEGERLAVEVINHHEQRLHVVLFVFGIDRSISQMFPPPGSPSQPIEPHQIAHTGSFRIGFPKELSLVPSADGHLPRQGFDYIRAFVTTQAVDFEPIVQDGLRAAPESLSLGPPSSSRVGGTTTGMAWAVETVTLRVCRRP